MSDAPAGLVWKALRDGVEEAHTRRGKWTITPHEGKFHLWMTPRFTRGMMREGVFDTLSAAKDHAENAPE